MLVVFLQGIVLYFLSSGQLRYELIEEKKEGIQAEMINLQEILQYLAINNEEGQIQETVALLGVDINTNEAFLFDNNNRVIASTRMGAIGNDLEYVLQDNIRNEIQKHSSSLIRNLKTTIWQSEDERSLYAISPIVLGRLTDESLRSDKIGIMYLHYDTGWIDNKNQEMLINTFLPMMLMLSIAGLGLSIYFNVTISRRIKAVNHSATNYSGGNYNERIEVSGNDEITDLGLAFNVMAQKVQAQREELLKRERGLSLTLNSIGDAVIVTDALGNITRINPVAEFLIALRTSEVENRPLSDVFNIINAQTREPVANPVEKVLRTSKVVGLANHTVLVSNNGEEYQISDSAAPICDENGDVLGVILVFRDVTQQNQTEEALRRSQKMEAIGQLSGGIAHDFNNQLGVIIGYLDFLKDYAGNDEKSRKWVGTATRAALRCTDLTRKLLSFSRIQTGKEAAIDINSILKELKTMFTRSVTPEVEVQYFLADDLWSTDIHPGEFQDAILNLVLNARDAMPNGGRLLIETSNQYLDEDYAALNPAITAGEYILLMLSDTGSGMDKTTQERIFEPFFTTKPEGKGTGLGMAMVYGFVKRFGGYIKIYSEPGNGTTIRLYLPRSTESEINTVTHDNRETELPTGSESILIVDDEVNLLELADQYLSGLGYSTCLAENASQALDILNERKDFDLLFCDVVMPGGTNGYELAQKATQLRPGLKVLLTSGFTSKTLTGNSLAHFSAHLLGKPYRKADLAQRIRRVLDEDLKCENPIEKEGDQENLAGCTILVVDDEEDVRNLFKLNLDKLGCKTLSADNGDKAIAIYQQSLERGEDISALILDLSLPGSMGGNEVADAIRAMDPHAKMIVASGHTEAPEMTRYQDFGFNGAINKGSGREDIKRVLERVVASN